MALTPQEETEIKTILSERVTKSSSRRMFDLEHLRMARGRTALTTQENTELDAHLTARESARITRNPKG
jgi:hypothetical protein